MPEYFKDGISPGMPWGVLGKNGEYKPRYGLWLDDSDECQQAVKGIVAEGYNFDLVLKWGSGQRQRITAKDFVDRMEAAGQLEPLNYEEDYVKEVYVTDPPNLRR